MGPRGLDGHFVPVGQQASAKAGDLRLQHWLAPREQDERQGQALHLGQDLIDGHVAAADEGVGGVAVDAAKIAARGANQRARQPAYCDSPWMLA
jgi:hypothetical protein